MGSSEHGHDYCWKLSAELSKKPNDFSILLSVADKEGFRIFITSLLLEQSSAYLLPGADLRKYARVVAIELWSVRLHYCVCLYLGKKGRLMVEGGGL